ncbi:MAG: hypothetical protein KGS61_20050, partial [Verrucomicrobia bacterium]|nr:hypothetical protein [Verrucomicrobiota bacterium]
MTTTNNVAPPAGTLSLAQALSNLHDGDTVQFDIPGIGPFYLVTPLTGYPLITNHHVTIDGFSQPGALPNTNPILAPNNARLQIVLDSRAGGHTPMNVPLLDPNDDPGYDPTGESALLGVVAGTNFTARGLCFLGPGPNAGDAVTETNLYFVAFARGASGGHISGCWMGVAPDATTLAGSCDGVAGFAYGQKDASGTTTNVLLIDDAVIGVAPRSTNAVAEFNVIVEATIPVILEGNRTRIAGNFLCVLPDGMHDDDVAFKTNVYAVDYQFQGAIQIGLGGNNTVIGTDGDAVND